MAWPSRKSNLTAFYNSLLVLVEKAAANEQSRSEIGYLELLLCYSSFSMK
jgi:hypothetical protein